MKSPRPSGERIAAWYITPNCAEVYWARCSWPLIPAIMPT